MSLVKRALLLSSVLVLTGCEQPPDPDAPRAPLPSEIKELPQPTTGSFGPRSIAEMRKEREAKKAKQDAEEAAAKAAQDGIASAPAAVPETPAAGETPKPADSPTAPPKS